jgi:hypothetical protein
MILVRLHFNRITLPLTICSLGETMEDDVLIKHRLRVNMTIQRLICTACGCLFNENVDSAMLKAHFKRDGENARGKALRSAEEVIRHLEALYPATLCVRSKEALLMVPGLTDGGKRAAAGIPIRTDGLKCTFDSCEKLFLSVKTMRQHISGHVHVEDVSLNKLSPARLTAAYNEKVQRGTLCQRPFGTVLSSRELAGDRSNRSFYNILYEVDPQLHNQVV